MKTYFLLHVLNQSQYCDYKTRSSNLYLQLQIIIFYSGKIMALYHLQWFIYGMHVADAFIQSDLQKQCIKTCIKHLL